MQSANEAHLQTRLDFSDLFWKQYERIQVLETCRCDLYLAWCVLAVKVNKPQEALGLNGSQREF